MTPIRHYSQYSGHLPHPSEGGRHCDREAYLHPFFPTYEASWLPATSSSLLTTCPGGPCERDDHQQQEVDQQLPSSGSTDQYGSLLTVPVPRGKREDFSWDGATAVVAGGPAASSSGTPAKWTSSKMRFMRKMMDSDGSKPRKRAQLALQDDHQEALLILGGTNNSTNSAQYGTVPNGTVPVRVCSDCNTTKTPLWRSGPRGPKSLCNACGIRQRKARRAMAAAALAGGVIPAAAVTPAAKVPNKEKKQQGECAVPFRKRCKFGSGRAETGAGAEELHVDEFAIGFGKNNNPAAFHRVFPQDEKEAAMLLMALSCGLIRG